MLATIISLPEKKTTGSVTYIKGSGFLSQSGSMERPTPKSLQEYFRTFSVDSTTANLLCLFCNGKCSAEDLEQFIDKNLRLVWKSDGGCFACCEVCLWASAKYELKNHFQCMVKVESVEYYSGKTLDNLVVRCVTCLKELSIEEKLAAYLYELDFLLVRGGWRSYCKSCVQYTLL